MQDIPLHIIQRGNNRNNCFFDEFDYMLYLALLRASTVKHDCALHAYVLMSNHVHLLVTPGDIGGPARMMKMLGEQYVQYVNRRYKRTGNLWQGRYRSCLVSDDAYFMVCQRYIELNPVRAGMVSLPAQYQWSSHQLNLDGSTDNMITPHALHKALGGDGEQRRDAYRDLFATEVDERLIEELRKSTNSNFAFGCPIFKDRMAQALGTPAVRRPPGRPRSHQPRLVAELA